MALTTTRVNDSTLDSWGKSRQTTFDVKITGTYSAGGYTINASDIGLMFFKGIDVVGGDVSQLTYYPFFDFGTAYSTTQGGLPTSAKLRLGTATGTEATGSLSPSVYLRISAYGG